ncbi:ASCH domain-containing protein [Enterococcus sp. LJL99]
MNQIELYIAKFKEKNPEYTNKEVDFYAFGRKEEMANDLAKLVFSGEKCGTTSLYQLYELENERIPQVDDLNVIIDGKGNPV